MYLPKVLELSTYYYFYCNIYSFPSLRHTMIFPMLIPCNIEPAGSFRVTISQILQLFIHL